MLTHFPFLAPALGLQGPGTLFHTLREVHAVVVVAVVQLSQLCQGQDVVAGDTQNSQL